MPTWQIIVSMVSLFFLPYGLIVQGFLALRSDMTESEKLVREALLQFQSDRNLVVKGLHSDIDAIRFRLETAERRNLVLACKLNPKACGSE